MQISLTTFSSIGLHAAAKICFQYGGWGQKQFVYNYWGGGRQNDMSPQKIIGELSDLM